MKIILNKLFHHQPLSKEEAKNAIIEISSGKANNAQLASFMTVFLMRPVTVNELSGFREALMEMCKRVEFEYDTIDVCGTGGDGKNTFNISTLSALVIAGAGVKVAKHGNYGVSSVSGSSNVLEYFGYKFTSDDDILRRQLDKFNICFLHAPLFHPALKHVGPVRRELGIKTFFNMLGPLVNPADPQARLAGVFDRELARVYHYILQGEQKKYAVVNTDGGYDEVSLTGNFSLFTHRGEFSYSPQEVGSEIVAERELYGGNSIDDAAKIFSGVLEGNGTPAQNKVVLTNAALGIQCALDKSFQDSYQLAHESLNEKKALSVFKSLLLN